MQTPAEPPASRTQIVTLTMNPALDITTSVGTVRPTEKLRCETTRYDPGGGGINVAHIAHVLGGSVSAVFPAGGPTGGVVMSLLNDVGVPFRQVAIAASTRESFTSPPKRLTQPGRRNRTVPSVNGSWPA
jgi:6-phosphofructokinase 2